MRLIFSGFFMIVCFVSPLQGAVIVGNSVADAEQHVNPGFSGGPGAMDLTSSDLELISEGDGGLDWQVVGLQYASLGIDGLSTINNAFITFSVDPGEVDLAGNLNLTIFGELTPNAVAFSTTDFDLTNRLRTTASVDWDFSTTNPATNAPWTVGQSIVTPNLAPIIQEIVNQTGWSANNQLTLLIVPDAWLQNPNGANIALPEIEIASRDLDGTNLSPLTIDFTAIPEPGAACALLFVGIAGLSRRRRR